MRIVRLPSADSTNTYLRSLSPSPEEDMAVVADCQTAGRGQRGNSWEAEPGKNLTFSILFHPDRLPASEQFLLSCALSLAITDILEELIPASSGKVRIKWPNDIYVDDQKICGILIENSLCGKYIERSILGVGLNVNQKDFRSDAPNPVSIALITGMEYDLPALLDSIVAAIGKRLAELDSPENKKEILPQYISRLWRFNSVHTYALPDGTQFVGAITGIAPDGVMTITDTEGSLRHFLFKEVKFIL